MFTPGVWEGASSYMGYVDTLGGFWYVPSDIMANIRIVRQLMIRLFDIEFALDLDCLRRTTKYFFTGKPQGNLSPETADDIAPGGYYLSNDRVSPSKADHYFLSRGVNPDAASFLHHFSRVCRREGIRCVYTYAPTFKSVAGSYASVLPNINKQVVAAGFKMTPHGLVEFGERDLGNCINHVHPDTREKYSKLYAERLLPLLFR